MATLALPGGRSLPVPKPVFPTCALPALLVALVLCLLNPETYTGGGADDARYLDAARCIAAHGYCVPADHWASRLPLVLPTGAIIWLLGESRMALAFVPLAYAVGALLLFADIVSRLAGERGAAVAALALVLTPIFIGRWLRLNVDIPELFFMLLAVRMLIGGAGSARSLAAAGAAVALAVVTRTSAAVIVPILAAGLFLFLGSPRRWALPTALGGSAILAAEAGLHWLTAGRPFLSWQLALGHTRIPTTALPSGTDLGRSPILNVELISSWHRAAGINLHWSVDGALNLIADPMIGFTLIFAMLLAIGWRLKDGRDWLPLDDRHRARTLFLAGAAAAHFALLTYVLAVHPAPRMFLPLVCGSAFAIGVWADRNRDEASRAVLATMLLLLTGLATTSALRAVKLTAYEDQAERWLKDRPEGFALTRTASRVFALSPALAALPVARGSRPGTILSMGPACRPPARTVEIFVHRPDAPIRYALAHRLGLAPKPLAMCLRRF